MSVEPQHLVVELVAVVVAVRAGRPGVLVVPPEGTGAPWAGLPAGPLEAADRSLQAATRSWVASRTGHRLGYLEQLYTFADPDRGMDDDVRRISVSYLGLTDGEAVGESWAEVYDALPWEDQRRDTHLVDQVVAPQLTHWVAAARTSDEREARRRRCDLTFGRGGRPWLPDLALQRYELLYEVGLLPESGPDHRLPEADLVPGERLLGDHRRILATGLSRLRSKIQYRPVVFELLPPEFTLGELQEYVEALAGRPLHKQNFRRLVDQQALVEETGGTSQATGGRPARLYRFRRSVLDERPVAGTRLPVVRPR